MTEHPATEHPDFEALSAFVDGEAPDAAAHVASCAGCRRTVDGIRSAITSLASVDPGAGAGAGPLTARRDAAVAAALAIWATEVAETSAETQSIGLVGMGDAVDSPTVEIPTLGPAPAGAADWAGQRRVVPLGERRDRRDRRRAAGRWNGMRIGSAAAAVVAMVVGVTALLNNTGSGPGTDVALQQPAPQTAESLAGPGGFTDAGEIGAVSSLTDLQGRVAFKQAQPRPPDPARSPAGSGANSGALATAEATGGPGGAGAVASASADNAGSTGDAVSRAFAAGGAVSRPCESEIRSSRTLGKLAFFGSLTYQGRPAVVLGFGPAGTEAANPLTFIVLSQEGCSVLAEWVAP